MDQRKVAEDQKTQCLLDSRRSGVLRKNYDSDVVGHNSIVGDVTIHYQSAFSVISPMMISVWALTNSEVITWLSAAMIIVGIFAIITSAIFMATPLTRKLAFWNSNHILAQDFLKKSASHCLCHWSHYVHSLISLPLYQSTGPCL